MLILVVAMAIAAGFLLWLGRETGYIFDEWYFWAAYRPVSLHTLLLPANGNLVLLPLALYKAVIAVDGIAYVPYRVVEVLLVLVNAFLFFRVASAGDRGREWLALGPAMILLFFGSSWDTVNTPVGIPTLMGTAFGLGALLLIERENLKGDVFAFVFLCLGLASFTTTVPFAIAIAVVILWDGGVRSWRRLLVPVLPLLAYTAYRSHYRDYPTLDGAKLSLGNVLDTPESFLASGKALVASVFGVFPLGFHDQAWQGLALGFVALLTVLICCRVTLRLPPNRRVYGYTAGLLSLWFSLAALGKDPIASRYQYSAAIFLLALLVELCAGLRIPRPAWAIAALVLAFAVVSNAIGLEDKREVMWNNTRLNQAKLAALEIIRDRVPDNLGLQFLSSPESPVWQDIYLISSGQYFDAAKEDGSPAMSARELRLAAEDQREAADRMMFDALALETLVRPMTLSACVPARRHGARWVADPGPLSGSFGVRAGDAPVTAQMRRYAAVSTTYPLRFAPHTGQGLTIPSDRSRLPWRVLAVADRPFDVCTRALAPRERTEGA